MSFYLLKHTSLDLHPSVSISQHEAFLLSVIVKKNAGSASQAHGVDTLCQYEKEKKTVPIQFILYIKKVDVFKDTLIGFN